MYPEYSIRWDKEKEQWVYQWTIRHHAKWDPERPLSESPTAYGYMLKHFGLDNLPEPLPIEKGCKMSPADLQQVNKTPQLR
ncbi:hypothetical protein A2164_00370 [Candidatus Curtissbacteria bacterium RBG_13_35_7]|uniref:Uncharacterized protein n=1 Tax=Candidatus Curtissbacteria bacterium RBG_13_35_7 TaxID=1797705 RepID=A0A1F5G0Y5_9BACT|nr:MAG: hypothetical protein A2164_00370 [Candidatus Curtissbacteria bacterium RBG_13_35_7]